jgi:hypothetical protein
LRPGPPHAVKKKLDNPTAKAVAVPDSSPKIQSGVVNVGCGEPTSSSSLSHTELDRIAALKQDAPQVFRYMQLNRASQRSARRIAATPGNSGSIA